MTTMQQNGPSENSAVNEAFDPERRPFGCCAPSPLFAMLRRLVVSETPPKFLKTWLYKLFSHFTRSPEQIFDIEYRDLKLRVTPAFSSGERWLLRKGKFPEESDFAILEPYRGQAAVFVDIGANIGVYSLMASQLIGEKARVVSIEPHPENRRRLAFHLAVNGVAARAVVKPYAVGAEAGELALYVRAQGNHGAHSLHPPEGAAETTSIPVQVRQLIDILREEGLERIDIVKIDIEGFEDRALGPFFEAAPEALWPTRVLIEALHQKNWERDIIADMQARGYEIERRSTNNLTLKRSV